jgi:hypothetical protein
MGRLPEEDGAGGLGPLVVSENSIPGSRRGSVVVLEEPAEAIGHQNGPEFGGSSAPGGQLPVGPLDRRDGRAVSTD